MTLRAVVLALAMLLPATAAQAGATDEAQALYRQFADAQNRHDLDAVRALLLDSPRFLWVSDGKSIWGRDAVIARMGLFQQARVWRVEPELDKAVAVPVGENTAFLHLPLELSLAFSEAPPQRLRFLVSVLCSKAPQGWRIAALFTTSENPD